MTADRSAAYGRVVRTLADLGPSKLHEREQGRIREAADTLVLAPTIDVETLEALDDVDAVVRRLHESGRWTEQRAAELAADVAACGPTLVELPEQAWAIAT